MNQLIRQFAEQAGFNLHNDPRDGHDFSNEIEQLSRAIVVECVALCKYDTEDDDNHYELGMAQKAKEIGQHIKKHFGIAE